MLYLNTKADFYNYLEQDTTTAIQALQEILDDRFAWQVTEVLLSKEDGIEDTTHMIMETDTDILQSELKEDNNAKLFQLGFTVQEAEEIIANPGIALAKYKGEVE